MNAIRHWRTATGQIASQAKSLGRAERRRFVREQLATLFSEAEARIGPTSARSDPDRDNARLILGWLKQDRKSIATLHHRLDDVVRLLEKTKNAPLLATLQERTQAELVPAGRDGRKLGRYFSSLRSLHQFASGQKGWKHLPEGLRYRQSTELSERHALTPAEVEAIFGAIQRRGKRCRQTADTQVPVADFVIALVLLCATAGLRIQETLDRLIGDIWITDRLTVVVANGKYEKQRTAQGGPPVPGWALDHLRHLWALRFAETGGNLRAPFFTGRLFAKVKPTEGQNAAYQRVMRFLRSAGVEATPHGLRRLMANMARAEGQPLLHIINRLGQSTVTTAPANYIQIYPSLQREQLQQWVATQDQLSLDAPLSLRQAGDAQGISREGAYKLLREMQTAPPGQIDHDGQRTTPIPLDAAIDLARYRIRKALRGKP